MFKSLCLCECVVEMGSDSVTLDSGFVPLGPVGCGLVFAWLWKWCHNVTRNILVW